MLPLYWLNLVLHWFPARSLEKSSDQANQHICSTDQRLDLEVEFERQIYYQDRKESKLSIARPTK